MFLNGRINLTRRRKRNNSNFISIVKFHYYTVEYCLLSYISIEMHGLENLYVFCIYFYFVWKLSCTPSCFIKRDKIG